ncbi:rhodanese-like domain-containing protein [Phytohalomonas tamaricis]|uniref:rhodanese-like domain-containing protein n=1 Tax=Phytohalomonas tamaricis TaxID=2081032 RepID=UPI000D0B35EE|nr:rhodanese-like domain-containing protein [Phytohalomonas tamaricis]
MPDSLVLEYPAPEPAASATFMLSKLHYHCDAWDLAEDLKNGVEDIIVIDARSREHYHSGHIPGAISLPHREMNETTTASLAGDKVYVVYCDGIGCNGSTKGAYKLACHGFKVKELLGGLDFWQRDGHPTVHGDAPGSMRGATLTDCGCA